VSREKGEREEAAMRIGVIGGGKIGGTVARLAAQTGHEVAIANSRGPESVEPLAAEIAHGARAATVEEAAHFGVLILLAIPFSALDELPADALAGARVTLRPITGAAAGAGASSVPGSGEGAAGAGSGAAPAAPPADVVKVTSAPVLTPRSLEAMRRTWYAVAGSRFPMPEVTVTGLSPLPALAGSVEMP
jgi:hypothetical protein